MPARRCLRSCCSLMLLLTSVGLVGCSSLGRRAQTEAAVVAALESDDADARRQTIVDLAESRQPQTGWVVELYTTVALLDPDDQTRCAAVRALSKTDADSADDTFIKILNHASLPATEVRKAGDETRFEAATALAQRAEQNRIRATQRERARDALIARLGGDLNRRVRAAAARGLGFFADDKIALSALLYGLQDSEFVVVYECDAALQRLTGEDHGCSAREWEQWYETHGENPFANAGAWTPAPKAQRKPMARTWDKVKRFFHAQ